MSYHEPFAHLQAPSFHAFAVDLLKSRNLIKANQAALISSRMAVWTRAAPAINSHSHSFLIQNACTNNSSGSRAKAVAIRQEQASS